MPQQRRDLAPRRAGVEQAVRRASNPKNYEHYAGLHGEDMPYTSGPLAPVSRAPATSSSRRHIPQQQQYDEEEYELEEDESYYETRPHSSAIRHTTQSYAAPRGARVPVVYQGPPPPATARVEEEEPPRYVSRHRIHPLVWVGVFIIWGLLFVVLFNMVNVWWQNRLNQQQCGGSASCLITVDAVVGHQDSPSNPTHFIAQYTFLDGQINGMAIIEWPGGDPTKAITYTVHLIPGAGMMGSMHPIHISFEDKSENGKPSMIVSIGDQQDTQLQVVLLNNGKKFGTSLSGQ